MSSLTVVIKAPNQKIDDQSIGCQADWTILRLKQHLSSVYPNQPRIEDQRLIFSGHLLKNEQLLRDVLKPTGDNSTFTIHLVCSQTNQEASRQPTTEMNSNRSNPEPADQTNRQSTDSGQPSFGNGFGWGQQPNAGQWETMQMNGLTPEQMFYQMSLMQQAYIQYMAQYFGPNLNQMVQQMPGYVQSNTTAAPVNNNNPQPGDLNQQPAARQPDAAPVQRLNAGPGAPVDDDDELNNRDWLDWIYYLSRTVIIFSILYFYSSITRFIVVIALAVLLYFYQTRRRQNRNNDRQNPAPIVRNDNNNNNNRNVNENDNLTNIRDPVEVEPENIPPEVNQRADPTERFAGLRLFWVIVSSLFTSLIPEQPAPVNLN